MQGPMPRPGDEAKLAFQEIVPVAEGVTTKPMFGNLAAFVHGNMFAGLFGEQLFVRLSDDDRERAMSAGGTDFQPMPGRSMKGYVTLPTAWRVGGDEARAWLSKALKFTGELPPKVKKGAKKR